MTAEPVVRPFALDAALPRGQWAIQASAGTGKTYALVSLAVRFIAEQDSLTGRTGRVPRRLHEARLAIAAAADIDPAELPFVAELIDVAPGEQAWRKAAEVTLYSIARVLLIEDSRLQQVSRAIDPVRLPVRVQFEGVAHRPHAEEPGDSRYVSGKLLYKESPFSWWIRQRVTRRGQFNGYRR